MNTITRKSFLVPCRSSSLFLLIHSLGTFTFYLNSINNCVVSDASSSSSFHNSHRIKTYGTLRREHDDDYVTFINNKLQQIRGGSACQENDTQNRIIKKDLNTIRKKKTTKKQKIKDDLSTTKSNKSIGGGKQGECLRRVKSEWKQMIKLGVAYDWVSKQTIQGKTLHSDNHINNYNYIRIGPFRNNLLHWHFSIQGPKNSVYQDGIYHGRIILPKDYPGSPPRVQVLTPSGRFIPGDDICLSASAFHPETWSPRWTILSLVEALRMHMLTTANEIGGMHKSDEIRRKMAILSRSWKRGYVDHHQMVVDGLFPSIDYNGKPQSGVESQDESDKCDLVEVVDRLEMEAESQLDQATIDLKRDDDTKTVEINITAMEAKHNQKESDKIHQAQMHISDRKSHIQRQPEKQEVIAIIFRGVIDFFMRHIEIGVVFLVVFLFLN